MQHLNDSLIIKAADAGVAGDHLVVQYVAAVADGVDRDGPNEALLYTVIAIRSCLDLFFAGIQHTLSLLASGVGVWAVGIKK